MGLIPEKQEVEALIYERLDFATMKGIIQYVHDAIELKQEYSRYYDFPGLDYEIRCASAKVLRMNNQTVGDPRDSIFAQMDTPKVKKKEEQQYPYLDEMLTSMWNAFNFREGSMTAVMIEREILKIKKQGAAVDRRYSEEVTAYYEQMRQVPKYY